MMINFTNHPSCQWNDAQRKAAAVWGEVLDIPFPSVPPGATEEELDREADQQAEALLRLRPDCVCCQGEMTLAFRVVNRLKAKGILCVAACSERKAQERKLENGRTEKTALFDFVCFREY